jgi:hydrogenase maturation factor
MQAGKLPLELLSKLLSRVDVSDPRVALGPRPGEDAALIDFGDKYLVAKTDPITFATDDIGWYLVQVNANDLAVMGATPRWLMVTLLLPEGTSEEAVEGIFDQLLEACSSRGITLVGGHTEVTKGLPRPIAVGAMLGEVSKDRVVLTSGARPGDSIVLTKGIAIEGTALLAREASDALLAAGVTQDTIEAARALLFDPGISVAPEATIACDTVDVHAMHDPTEGGLATGLMEMAKAAGVGLLVYEDKIRLLPESKELCGALGLDPFGLIASGALLAAVSPRDTPLLIEALVQKGIAACEIGRVTSPDKGIMLRTPGGDRRLPTFERDELARWFDG